MRKKILLLVFICFILNPVFSKDLTLNNAVNQALLKSTSILQKSLEIDSAQIDEDNKYSTLYPTIQATSTLQRSNTGVTSYLTGVTADPTVVYAGGLSASFSFNPAMITSLQTTALKLQDKSISLAKAKKDLSLQVKKLYYGILLQKAAVGLQEENLDNMNHTLENTIKAYEDGNVAELTVLQLKTQIASMQSEFEKSKNAIDTQKRTLAFLIGEDNVLEPLTLIDELPTTYNDDISSFTLTSALNYSSDLDSTSLNKQILDVQTEALTQSMYFPSISLSVSYSPLIYDVTQSWDSSNYKDSGSISATLVFNLSNLLPSSSTKTSIKQLNNAKDQLTSVQMTLKKNIVMTYSGYVDSINHAKKQIALSNDNIALAEKTYFLTSLSYENGDTSFSDLKSAQLNLSNSKLSLLQAQFTYLSAYLDLESQCTL